jgi:antitoxin YefM
VFCFNPKAIVHAGHSLTREARSTGRRGGRRRRSGEIANAIVWRSAGFGAREKLSARRADDWMSPFATLPERLEVCLNVARIMVMSETMSLAAAKARFSELVDRVARQQDRVVVTRNGKPAAVLISPEDLDSLEETLTVMSDRSLAAQIRESEKAAAAGERGVELDELRAALMLRRDALK